MSIDYSDEVGWPAQRTTVWRDKRDPRRLAEMFPQRHANPHEAQRVRPLWMRALEARKVA